MIPSRGDVWYADLNPIRGAEQAGTRPVLIYQNNVLNRAISTVLAIPFTTNVRRAGLPTCYLIEKGNGGLTADSVALCHQLRVLDKSRLTRRLGSILEQSMYEIDKRVLFSLGLI